MAKPVASNTQPTAPGTPSAATRSRGRPRSGGGEADNAVGRDALIDATIDLLRTRQPAAITPIVVARAIGVHPSLIRYYFKNRASLLVAVAERLTQRFAAQVDGAAQSAGTAEDRLCERIGALIDLNAAFPFFHQLFAGEIAQSEDPLAREMVTQMTNRGTAAYGTILRAGLIDGSFRGMDPGLLYATVVGMSEFFLSARRQFEIAQGQAIDEAELRAVYKAFVCDLVLNGVRSRKD